MIAFFVNGKEVQTEAPGDTPLLWFLRDELGLTGTKFACGIARCGACMVHVHGAATRSCVMPISGVRGKRVTTIEGLSPTGEHPVQKAWIAEQVPQCGFCQSGQIMAAAAFLEKNDDPTREEIIEQMSGNLCRCGTYNRIIAAIERAAAEIRTLAPLPEEEEEVRPEAAPAARPAAEPKARR